MAACPLCGRQFPESELELHVNHCLDAQQTLEDENIAATIGRDGDAAPVTVPYRPQPWTTVRQPDPEAEEAVKRALAPPPPPIINMPAPPAPPPAVTVPVPPTPGIVKPAASPAVPKPNAVFDADASHAWVETVRSEIVRPCRHQRADSHCRSRRRSSQRVSFRAWSPLRSRSLCCGAGRARLIASSCRQFKATYWMITQSCRYPELVRLLACIILTICHSS